MGKAESPPSQGPKSTGRGRVAASTVSISQNRLGGAGAVELRRGGRLDIFGGEDIVLAPPDYFDLSSADEAAADMLTAALEMPSVVRPFQPFTIAWEVGGPGSALARVSSYQLNVFSSGPIFGLSAEPSLTSDGLKARGTVIASMWRSGEVALWARFGSGIRELTTTTVEVDLSECSETRLPLFALATRLRTDGAAEFLAGLREEAGEDVTVTPLADADASYSSNGITFSQPFEFKSSDGRLVVDLAMQFTIVPRAGHLGASFLAPGYRTVSIDPDLPWVDDFWHKITLGEHNLSEYQTLLTNGLKRFADGFAAAVGREARGLPDEDDESYDEQEADAPKVVATAIDMDTEDLVVTLCPVGGGLISVGGLIPASLLKLSSR